jgi:hypothetical protein
VELEALGKLKNSFHLSTQNLILTPITIFSKLSVPIFDTFHKVRALHKHCICRKKCQCVNTG